ncbi:MAG: M42 family metallopeptidase [Chloroflexi bacterium]|nr:M42 family metallopeptidase [Chloroflexota bacterium]
MDILQQLSEAMGVSGAEQEVRRIIRDMIADHVDEIETDTMGNLFATKYASSETDFTVMVDAHMDEVGMMVMGHNGDGTLKIAAVGGLDDRLLPGLRVLVGPKKIPGVIGAKPVHLLSGGEYNSVTKIDNLRVDIGLSKKEAAKGKAPLGTRIGFASEFTDLGAMLRGKSFDDRVGCAVLVHLLQGERYPFNLVGAFTVQEEVGLRGATIAANRIKPHVGVALEGTIADDLPKEGDTSPTTELGKGPALSVMDRSVIYDARLNNLFVETADELCIPYQFKQPGIGGTDGGAINRSEGGVPVVAVSVPCRYIHSPRAMLHKDDYLNTIELVRAGLARLAPAVVAR